MTAAAAWIFLASAFLIGPSIYDRARRNHRARRARAALVTIGAVLDELAEWHDALGGDCPIYDQLVCEQIEMAEGWSA